MLVAALFAPGCASLRICGNDDPWWGPDKAKHLAGASLLGAGITLAADDAALGIGVTTAAGAGKELYDLNVKKTCWSWKDLAWDFIGASLGATAALAAD